MPVADTAMTATVPRPAAFRAHPSDHRFYNLMSIVCAAVILTGFASKYLPRFSAGATGLPPIIHFHAAVFTGWLGLFIAQTTLVSRGRIDLHRKLGVAGVVFAALMLIVGVQAALTVARLGHRGIPGVESPDPAGFLLVNLNAIIGFSLLVAAGWVFRRRPQTHKRIMLLAMVSLMPPGIARLPLIGGHLPAVALTVVVFVIAGPIYDFLTRKRVHRAYIWGGLLILVPAPPVLAVLAATSAWHTIASWLI